MTTITSYVAQVRGLLHLRTRDADRLLEEIEAHLLDATDAAISAGLTREQAERRAVSAFGPATAIAAAANGGPIGALARLTGSLAVVGALGTVAVALGTLLAHGLASVTSTRWVFGLPPGSTASAAQVHHWLAVQPSARTWQGAAALENSDDSLLLRGGAAVLGLVLALVVVAVVTRRYRTAVPTYLLTASALVLGLAALALAVSAGLRLDALDRGTGQAFSDATVALIAALGCVLVRRRRLHAVQSQ
ncbi:MAG: permease prefix domain 1-containing protein [Marmoricola sp.]